MKVISIIVPLFLSLVFTSCVFADSLAEQLQQVSVTVKSNSGQGSGVLISRKIDGQTVNFVITAAHVVDGLRSVREVIDSKTGQTKKVIEFKDAQIVQEVIEGGRRVGEFKMNAKVIKYSDAERGEDLALLWVRKKGLSEHNTKFFLDGDKTVVVGTNLYHVGSLLGQDGANSFLEGVLSQIGRTIELNNGEEVLFDQVNVGAMPGSSGGGVFLKNDGKYVGMLVRGAGPTFGLIVPVRRMWNWVDKNDIEWVMDDSAKIPSLKEILEMPVE